MRRIRNIITSIIVIAGVFWLLQKADVIPSLKNIFKAEPVVIDKTPILIKQIKSIGQLISYTSFDEVVVASRVSTPGSALVNTFNKLLPVQLPSLDKELVLIGRGKVLAGTDLTKLADSSISIKNDTVRVFIPKAQILDAIVNPSDFETFKEKGQWSSDEVTRVKIQARQKMIDRALQKNILEKADVKSKDIMYNFLSNMGYKNILVY